MALTIWFGTVPLRLAHRRVWPLVSQQRDRIVIWALAWPGVPCASHSVTALPQPRSIARASDRGVAAAGWRRIVSGHPGGRGFKRSLVQFDHVVFTTLQKLRMAWADEVMIITTELGSAMVAVTVIAGRADLILAPLPVILPRNTEYREPGQPVEPSMRSVTTIPAIALSSVNSIDNWVQIVIGHAPQGVARIARSPSCRSDR